ncbi:MAG: crossover junction endodeoxyribonuclease RuvC [Bacteroides sp.]|nr:crossover junction endodeoxyribonuclease RuvC [Bacteroides sp.]
MPCSSSKTILGIDPGTRIMGYGLIRAEGQKFSHIEMGVLNLTKESDALVKLERIHEEVIRLIDAFSPDSLSIETPFYGKNVQSLIKLGRAQGVAIAAAMSKGVQVYEYAPLKIKQSLTGNGNASKEQVCAMVFRVLGMQADQPRFLDATDAMAAAICHGIHSKFNLPGLTASKKTPASKSKKGNWADFLQNHPERLR